MVVQCTSFVDVACLERKLQTAAAHAKAHGIKIDMIREGGSAAFPIIAEIAEIFDERIGSVHVPVNWKEEGKIFVKYDVLLSDNV